MAEWLENFLYKKSWKIATATEGIKEYMIRKGKNEKDVFLLPNGVNTDTFHPMPKDKDLLKEIGIENKKVFMYAGTLGYAQGLDSVLRAAALLKEREPDVHFLFVGDGQEREKLLKLKEDLKLDNVTFYGSVPVSEMPRMFSIADFSIVSLRNIELFKGARPSKIFPAISTGTPVLYCGDGESAAILEEYQCGKIAPPENPEGIASAVSELMKISENEYEQMCQNGRKLAVEQYSWKSIVDDLLVHIQEAQKQGADSIVKGLAPFFVNLNYELSFHDRNIKEPGVVERPVFLISILLFL